MPISKSNDLAAIRVRVELVAEALELPASEVDRAMSEPADRILINFARQYGQSLDWLIRGDLRPVVRELWRRHFDQPRLSRAD